MSEYFKGLKRRAGCVTLLMACAFFAAWIWSYLRDVYIEIPGGGVGSAGGGITLFVTASEVETPNPGGPTLVERTVVDLCTVPYWLIVLPLTLLSAWLLLSKPQTPKPIESDRRRPDTPPPPIA